MLFLANFPAVVRDHGFDPEINVETELNSQSTYFVTYKG